MDKDENFPQYPTRQAMDKFNQLLNLHEDKYMQDWEIELADDTRLDEFLECYHSHAKTNEEKFTLMSLIIASFDDYYWEDESSIMWGKIKPLLLVDRDLFKPLIEYWCAWDGGDNPEYYFNISPLMREISRNSQ